MLKYRNSWSCALVFFAAALPVVARAQIFDTQFSGMMLDSTIQSMTAYNTMQTTIEDTRRHDREVYLRDARPSSRHAPPLSGQVDFFVRFDPAVSVEARRDFLDSVRRRNSERVVNAIAAEFDRKDVRRAFRDEAGPYGLRGDDYGDVFAAYMVTMWLVANQAPLPDVGAVRAVNEQAHEVLAYNGLQGSRRERQLAAEGMMYELVSAIYARQEAERVGDTATLDRMARLARAKFMKSGMDLQAMVISDAGMVRR